MADSEEKAVPEPAEAPAARTEARRESDAGREGAADNERLRARERQRKLSDGRNISRRTLCIGLGGTAVLLGLGGLRYAGHTPLRRPPGGQDEAHLVSACIRCERCYEACPRKVIIPAHIEDGLLGVRSPTLDYNAGYCDFCAEENGGVPKCAEVCPTDALRLPADANARNTIIGLAAIDTRTCLAYRDTGCRYCYDACPYQAIELNNEGVNPRPYVVNDKCNGCGACESACVSLKAGSIVDGATERAIVVHALGTL